MKILLTGGSGCLGSELRKLREDLDAPDETRLDVTDAAQVLEYVRLLSPSLVIHAAAITNNRDIEEGARVCATRLCFC